VAVVSGSLNLRSNKIYRKEAWTMTLPQSWAVRN
jgi:hypothetical protein